MQDPTAASSEQQTPMHKSRTKDSTIGQSEPRGLYVPQPQHRTGAENSFGRLNLSAPGEILRPEVTASASTMRELPFGLIRVLNDAGRAVGPWNPRLPPSELRRGLRAMLLTRLYDERMVRAQRQAKASFYIQCRGEEAVACAQAMALRPSDMCFTTYRLQGVLITRGYPLVDMMNQIYSNASDPLKGRMLPILYSSRQYGFFSQSGAVATQFCHAVGWAMACAYRGSDDIAAGWIGDGATAQVDFHDALTFASVYRAPVILNVVNNQWAISTVQEFAGTGDATFASRAIGYGLPGLRVDGNDFLAVFAVTQWAAERARRQLGATLIELYTYRAGAHSTSDDPTRYRPAEEQSQWPLGDPVERLKEHLKVLGEWTDEQHDALSQELTSEVREAGKKADAVGSFGQSKPNPSEMFFDVYKTPDWRLQQQAKKAGF